MFKRLFLRISEYFVVSEKYAEVATLERDFVQRREREIELVCSVGDFF